MLGQLQHAAPILAGRLAVGVVLAGLSALGARLMCGSSRRIPLVAAVALAMVVVCAVWTGGPDYPRYLEIWRRTLAGGDPWALDNNTYSANAYGPLFNLLAPLTVVSPIAPKMLFSVLWGATIAFALSADIWLGLLLIPFAITEGPYWGHFDIVPALTIVAALQASERRKDTAAGGWLAAGFLLKILPLLLLPYLAFERRAPRWRLIGGALAVSAAGLLFAAWTWGAAVVRPFEFAGTRPSQMTSMFAFVRVAGGVDADFLSGPLLVSGLAVLFLWAARQGFERSSALAVAALTIALVFYKVGYPQYQTMLIVPAVWLVSRSNDVTLYRAVLTLCGWWSVWNSCRLIFQMDDLLKVLGAPVACLVASGLVGALLVRPRETTAAAFPNLARATP